jgi:opine dehydrogenase
MKVAVLGGGGGGASAAVDLVRNGIAVKLWSRSPATVQAYRDAGGVRYEGVLGSGLAEPEEISTDLARITRGVDAIMIVAPSPAHREIAAELARLECVDCPVVLNPGHTGGALEFREAFRRRGLPAPPLAELSTLTYVARKSGTAVVNITGTAKRVWVSPLPGGAAALNVACRLYPCAAPARDVLFTGLSNVNLVLHPPGAVLGASWIESTAGGFTFYVQGLSAGVARVMEALDAERLAVGESCGHKLPALFQEMQAIGTIEPDADAGAGLANAIRQGRANRNIMAPDSLEHRYFREDFWYGIRPFLEIASIAGVDVPVAGALMTLAKRLVNSGKSDAGRNAEAMGISGLKKDQLLETVGVG